MSRRSGLIAAGSVVLLVVGVVLRLIIPDETWSKIVGGVVAAAGAVGPLVEWVKDCRAKQKRVKADAVFLTPERNFVPVPTIGVRLVNAGPSVNISRVYFNGDDRDFYTVDRVGAGRATKWVEGLGVSGVKMDSEDCYTFFSHSLMKGRNGRDTLAVPPESFWIVVDTPMGEVARVSGTQIQEVVRKAMSSPPGTTV